jgi:hypothetical protein
MRDRPSGSDVKAVAIAFLIVVAYVALTWWCWASFSDPELRGRPVNVEETGLAC